MKDITPLILKYRREENPGNNEVAMSILELCTECGVPLIVSNNLYRKSNGVMEDVYGDGPAGGV
jgi:hypothetical protein